MVSKFLLIIFYCKDSRLKSEVNNVFAAYYSKIELKWVFTGVFIGNNLIINIEKHVRALIWQLVKPAEGLGLQIFYGLKTA